MLCLLLHYIACMDLEKCFSQSRSRTDSSPIVYMLYMYYIYVSIMVTVNAPATSQCIQNQTPGRDVLRAHRASCAPCRCTLNLADVSARQADAMLCTALLCAHARNVITIFHRPPAKLVNTQNGQGYTAKARAYYLLHANISLCACLSIQ